MNRVALALGWSVIAVTCSLFVGVTTVAVGRLLNLGEPWTKALMSWAMSGVLAFFAVAWMAYLMLGKTSK